MDTDAAGFTPPPARAGGLLRELRGGAFGALVSLAVVLTLGLLGFAPLGEAAPDIGIPAAITTAIGGSLLLALGARGDLLPVAGPSSATALMFAGLLLELLRDPALPADPAAKAALVLPALGAAVSLAGAGQLALGLARLGRLARFVPQPVLAGFMNGVALLILIAQVPPLLGLRATPGGMAPLADSAPAALALGLLTAGLTWVVAWRRPHLPAQLIGFCAGLAAYALLHAAEVTWSLGPAVGPLPGRLPMPDVVAGLLEPAAAQFAWRHAPQVLTAAAVIALIGALESVLSALALDQMANTRRDIDRLLVSLGLANLLLGQFGALPAVQLRARAMAIWRAGGRGAWASAASAAADLALFLLCTPLIALLPRSVLAGVMLTIAVALADHWSRQLAVQFAHGERTAEAVESLLMVALVCAITVTLGFAPAVAAGVLLSLLIFARAMNRSLLRSVYGAQALPSRRLWSPAQEQRLAALRPRAGVLELEGALFFGSVERLRAAMERHAAGWQCVVLDLRHVTTIDASGALTLQQLSERLAAQGRRLLLAGVSRDDRHGTRLRAFGCFRAWPRDDCFPDVDRAVEAAERALLGAPEDGTAVPLEASVLLEGLAPAQQAAVVARMQPRRLAAGERLFEEGDPGDALYVVAEGSITVVARNGRRFVSVSPGGMLGETAMLDPGGRSAGAMADADAMVWRLSQDDLQALAAEDPALATALYRHIARHLAHRLRIATAGRRDAEAPAAPGSQAR